ncbi:polysaccharide deacetylase family protein [Acetivibrio clariflavus]|uniref:Putative xylanase/chitin deacetylase n=1 Tax=Acetivibrio clariflavus (strain DSM 19732 / NBRC 101661 / EBR45) TaxID=720554 RepID=G8M0R8_ACECE|nr:polysaccharide deacetylase family protein [Acetivibrio clariflavus]AEV69149.1 putative xylanase/chitin deacetylase [Acetivibrio clariflavus DSM 19732]
MRLYVIKLNTIHKCVLIGVLALVLCIGIFASRETVAEVFEQKRDLPIYSVECDQKKVSITFDCAWGADDIPDIVNTLKEHNIRATFFFVGHWAEKNPDMVKLIADNGHDIANHSYSHLRMGAIDNNRIRTEILKCDEVLKRITGKKPELFRAPYGDYNNDVVRIARELNEYTIQWNVDSLDWKPGITPEQIKNRVLNNVDNGSIILFHNDTPHTAKILPSIIKGLQDKGFEIVPVSKLIMRENYEINFEGRQIKKK